MICTVQYSTAQYSTVVDVDCHGCSFKRGEGQVRYDSRVSSSVALFWFIHSLLHYFITSLLRYFDETYRMRLQSTISYHQSSISRLSNGGSKAIIGSREGHVFFLHIFWFALRHCCYRINQERTRDWFYLKMSNLDNYRDWFRLFGINSEYSTSRWKLGIGDYFE